MRHEKAQLRGKPNLMSQTPAGGWITGGAKRPLVQTVERPDSRINVGSDGVRFTPRFMYPDYCYVRYRRPLQWRAKARMLGDGLVPASEMARRSMQSSNESRTSAGNLVDETKDPTWRKGTSMCPSS